MSFPHADGAARSPFVSRALSDCGCPSGVETEPAVLLEVSEAGAENPLISEADVAHSNRINGRVQDGIHDEQAIEILIGLIENGQKLAEGFLVNLDLDNEDNLKETSGQPAEDECPQDKEGGE